jgi:hypothetical protein
MEIAFIKAFIELFYRTICGKFYLFRKNLKVARLSKRVLSMGLEMSQG